MATAGRRGGRHAVRRRSPGAWALGALAGGALLLAGCSAEDPGAAPGGATGAGPDAGAATEPEPEAAADPARLAARGEQVYRNVCTACHAFDPRREGAVGPAIAGSSLELLRAKVLRNEYPPGYTPKRDTRAMIPLPHVEPDLPALAAYLERAASSGS